MFFSPIDRMVARSRGTCRCLRECQRPDQEGYPRRRTLPERGITPEARHWRPHRNLREMGNRQNLTHSLLTETKPKNKTKHLQKKSSATFTEKNLRGRSPMRCSKDLINHSWSIVSKNPSISASNTQFTRLPEITTLSASSASC